MKKIIIEEADNGYCLTYKWTHDNPDGTRGISSYKEVIEGNERNGFEKLVKALDKDLLDGYNSFSKENIRVSWDVLGDEVEETK